MNAPLDSYDPMNAAIADINGISSSKETRKVAKAVVDKYYQRDDKMYNTIELKANIALENTKDERAEKIK